MTQPWSSGKVGLNGITFYGMNQRHVATLQPPHLAAMCIREGSADWYRDMTRHGGKAPYPRLPIIPPKKWAGGKRRGRKWQPIQIPAAANWGVHSHQTWVKLHAAFYVTEGPGSSRARK